MNNHSNKISLKLPKSEMSDIVLKQQDCSKYGAVRGKTDIVNNKRTPSGSLLRPDSPARNYKKTDTKTKQMDTSHRSSAKVTSEGVHEFIKSVSNFIEKKTPFKETEAQQQSKTKRKNTDSNPVNSIQFNGVSRKTQEKRKLEKYRNEDKKSNSCEKNTLSDGSPKQKENSHEPVEYKSKTENQQKLGYSSSDWNQDLRYESERHRKTPHMRPSSSLYENDLKRKRPSEIPLRKTQKCPDRPCTSSLTKPLKENESVNSFFPNFDDIDLQTEFQMTFDFNFNTDDICSLGKRDSDRIINNLTGDICTLPENSFLIENLLTTKPSFEKKGKSNLENKELTSSFTVLSKLESLHKQTLSAKDRDRNPKASLKGDKSKKSGNKESKTGLKLKTKKPKNGEITKKKSEETLRKSTKGKILDNNKAEPCIPIFPEYMENESPRKSTCNRQKVSGLNGNTREKDYGKSSSKFSRQGFDKPETPNSARSSSDNSKSKSSSNSEEKNVRLKNPDRNHPITPPPTPETVETTVISSIGCDEGDDLEWSAKTLLCDDKFTSSDFPWCKSSDRNIEISHEISESELPNLIVKGKSLMTKDEPPEKPEEPDQPTVKKHLKIDLRTHEDVIDSELAEEILEEKFPNNWSMKDRFCGEKTNWEAEESKTFFDEIFSEGVENREFMTFTSSDSCKSFKDLQKGNKKDKVRSDTGDRSYKGRLFDSNLTQHNKIKPDAKLRSGLTKSSNREETRDSLEEAALLKLKRCSSQPTSFRGFVWKCADRVIPKDHKASVSSMTSSLRHLNTDEIDDFILWEAIPQKVTCWWEMSLYNYKRTWSVLSLTVFKDNRKSSTPGLILENLRNGITHNKREPMRVQNDRATCRKENPFDVEPSIAQKNIDIRNWLAALNFSTPPSASTEVIPEGNFSSQPKIDPPITSKVSSKRRMGLSTFMYPEDKSEEDRKWNSRGNEILPELIRRQSGEFSKQEKITSQPSIHQIVLSHSKSVEETTVVDLITEPKKYKSVEMTSQAGNSWSLDEPVENLTVVDSNAKEGMMVRTINNFRNFLKKDLNIWKFLFLLTLIMVLLHYCFLTGYTSQL